MLLRHLHPVTQSCLSVRSCAPVVLADRLPTGLFAFTYASLGDRENAFRWLNKAYQERHWCIMYLNDDLVWAPIRPDPRFTDLLRRVGLLAETARVIRGSSEATRAQEAVGEQ
jgi:hypothetical protein